MDILGQSALLVGMTSFGLGASLLARNARNKLFIAFAVVTTLVSGWALAFFLERIWGTGISYRFHLFFNIWLGPAALAFIRMMTRVRERFSRRLLDFGVLLSLCLTVALILHLDSQDWVLQLIYFAPGLMAIQILELMWIDRRLRRGFHGLPKLPTVGLNRRNLIYVGGLLVLATSVMDHVPWMGTVVPSIGNLGLTVYLFFLSQAISQQRLLNFAALVSRFLVLLSLAFVLTCVYSLLVAWIENSPGLFFLNSFIASFLLISLLEPLRRLVGYLSQRLLTQKHQRLEQTLRDAQRNLTGITDSGSLFHTVLLFTQQILEPQWAGLFILRSDGTRFRRTRAIGEPAPLPEGEAGPENEPVVRELLADHPLLEQCKELNARGQLPVVLDAILEGELDRSASHVQREHLRALIQNLKALGSNLLIPLIDSGRTLGFIVMSVPSPPEPWGSNWGLLSVIYPFYEQAAHTLRNLEIYVRQREKERLAELGQMSAGLAHEIRNPLGAIKGAAQFLDPASDRPDGRFLRIIVEEVDRLNHVVTQFLDYSKPPATDFKPVDVATLASRTVETLRPSLPEGVSIEFAAREGKAWVLGDAGPLQQVLVNLLQNAVKAVQSRRSAPEGARTAEPGRVWVSVDVEGPSSAREVVAQVQDNGCGIRRENLDKLFIPFFTTSPSGTGLGLSISQKIVESHRGRIEVASEEGRFSRFSVILPLQPADADAERRK